MTTNQYALTKDQVRLYHVGEHFGARKATGAKEGGMNSQAVHASRRRRWRWCGGLLMRRFWSRARAQGLAERDYFHNRHLDNRCVYELATWTTAASMSC